MKLQFDISHPYAVALEGGGARGAWQVGAWRALNEAGVTYDAVSGTSVGALNGVLMAMRDLAGAMDLWNDIHYSQIMDVNEDFMKKLMAGSLSGPDLVRAASSLSDIVKDGGFDIRPLRDLISSKVDEEKVRASDVRFFLVTYCLTDRQLLELDGALLPDGMLADMLMASAYFPAFKQIPLGGKYYIDGGVQDVLPLHILFEKGYRDVIALRIHGTGVERLFIHPKDAAVHTIEPKENLGSVLAFEQDKARRNMQLGYCDAMRFLYGLEGQRYYIDRTMSEKDAYQLLAEWILAAEQREGRVPSLRQLHEKLLPKLEMQSGRQGDYYAALTGLTEKMAEKLGLDNLRILTDRMLYEEVMRTGKDSARKTGLLKYLI